MDNRIVICPYCGKKAELKTGREIYAGRGSWDGKKFWVCEPCNAWVGCHDRNERYGRVGDEPLGRLANKELREAKMKAHLAFDPIWKKKSMKRKEAYAWLAKKLGIPADECHIGMFDVDMCREVVIVMSDSTWEIGVIKMSHKKYRLNIELTDQVMKRLDKLVVESDSSSKTDVIRKSLALYETIMRIRKEDGQVILLLKDGNQMELVF